MMAQLTAPQRPLLDQLLAGIATAPAVPITDLALDSRNVTPGTLFLACQGHERHGLDYLEQVLAAAPAAIAYEPRGDVAVLSAGVPAIAVPTLRGELGRIARRFFADPSAHLDMTAVTGTNGKTTVAWLLAGALRELGRPAGYIGTLGAGVDTTALGTTGLTTPDSVELSRWLARFLADGAEACALEASSHALAQGRLDGLSIDTAVFTNISHDHLDYHGSFGAYTAAKARLFERRELVARVVNVDDAFGADLAERYNDAWRTSRSPLRSVRPRSVFAERVVANAAGLNLSVRCDGATISLRSPLYGVFNVDNLLAVLAVLVARGAVPSEAAAALGRVGPPPGRMQRVDGVADISVVVDFAHTADALTQALAALRSHSRGRLVCIFGAGGDRDRSKRAPMGAAAARGADRLVITSDNPRHEDPERIIADIVAGVAGDRDTTIEVDRRTAIAAAIRDAEPGDVLLIAGRGHESHQLIGGERIEFDDATVARTALETRR